MSSRRSGTPKNHSSRTLQSRNFGSNQSFLANPKIKIFRIIEVNTMVAFVLLQNTRIYPKPPNPPFFRVLFEVLEGHLGQYSES